MVVTERRSMPCSAVQYSTVRYSTVQYRRVVMVVTERRSLLCSALSFCCEVEVRNVPTCYMLHVTFTSYTLHVTRYMCLSAGSLFS